MNKKEAREILFTLVYEYEFNTDKSSSEIYDNARSEREFENFRYIKKGLSDIISNKEFLGNIIEERSDGWKIYRMAPVTRSILYVAAYDMILKNTTCAIAINEAVELAKKYDDPSSVSFINGILNSIAEDLESIKATIPADESAASDEE